MVLICLRHQRDKEASEQAARQQNLVTGPAMPARETPPKTARPAHASTRGMVFIAAALIAAAPAGCSSPAPVHTQGARILHLTIDSRFVRGAKGLTLATPAGGDAHRPLLVFLHGVIYNDNSQLTGQMFAVLRALGPRAPDIAFPSGDQSYWHNRASGAWAPTCWTR
jgi:poly(3-hydroxybutyrate) depolymerase